jgi:hypothetical protein
MLKWLAKSLFCRIARAHADILAHVTVLLMGSFPEVGHINYFNSMNIIS